jgi:hypothetical protein
MPLNLVNPKPGRTSFYRVRGHECGIHVDRSTGTTDKKTAERLRRQWIEEAGRAAVLGRQTDEPTFASAALAYMKSGRSRRFVRLLLLHFQEKPLAEIDQAAIDAAAVAIYGRDGRSR